MARTSRKQNRIIPEKQRKESGFTALYARISSRGEMEKASLAIKNQKSFLRSYAERNKVELGNIKEYEDIGFTGTNFDRPAFQEMMDDVKNGRVKCVIVKDFSRFGRNFIETSDYIENILPLFKIRFISINDGFDTNRTSFADYYLTTPLKNIMNEQYSRDVSVKGRSVKKALRKRGCFTGPHPMYGYVKSPEDKHVLCIDPEPAVIVQRIFHMADTGMSDAAIARTLNYEGIFSPAKYKFEKGMYYNEKYSRSRWYPQTVAGILTSRCYIGDMVQGIRLSEDMNKKKKKVPEEQQDIIPNRHESIISEEQFYRIRALRNERYKKNLASPKHIDKSNRFD